MKRLSDVSNEAVHRGSCVWLKGGKREDGCGRDLVEVWEQKKKEKKRKEKKKQSSSHVTILILVRLTAGRNS